MSKLYTTIIDTVDKFVPRALRPMWMHPAGPKTVFFWGPAFKWGLVIAGFGDMNRPAETISINQALSLAITGVIWSRYAMVIIPKNMLMLSVNSFMAVMQTYQAYRAISYRRSQKPE